MFWTRYRAYRRAEFIRSATLPMGLFERLRKQHTHLTLKDCQLVGKGLRQFFLAYHNSGYAYVSMPSQVVDDLWHEFILTTKDYEAFCKKAFGRFFHHTPAVVLKSASKSNEGLRRCWLNVCREELINPRNPTRLPLLFALDKKLKIVNGFHYEADCSVLRRQMAVAGVAVGAVTVMHCGGDFIDASIDGGTAGMDSEGPSADGDAGGAGTGDGGCGGGCGGGGGD